MSRKKECLLYNIVAILFVFFCYSEYILAKQGNIIWDANVIIKVLLISVAAGVVLGGFIIFLLHKMEYRWSIHSEYGSGKWPSGKKLFGISWGSMFLCWLPGFFAYYPGINAYDFVIQLGQITGNSYNSHHPLAHTLFMGMFIQFGNWLGSATLGVALYILVQMSILAAALASGIVFLRSQNIKPIWLVCIQILACFMPSHLYMSISATKDTLFTAFVLLFLISLCRLIESKENKVKVHWLDVCYMVQGMLVIAFRNNGIYTILVLAAFLALAVVLGKKLRFLWMKIFLETVVILVAGSFLLSGLFQTTGAVQGDKREMLSIPIQQLSRTMVYHGGIDVIESDDHSMSENDIALINEFILYEGYRYYNPAISDPVKSRTNTYVFVYRMKDFFRTYLNLLKEYPGDFINAFLAVNAGYLSPFDTSHAHINEREGVSGLGYMQTIWQNTDAEGIFRESKLPGLLEKMETFADKNMYLKIPGLNILMVPGTYFWVFLVISVWLLIHKKFELLLPFALLLGYFATLFLGPTVQMRYIYPVMTVLPYLILWAWNKIHKDA